MDKNVLIVNYNTTLLTQCCIKSVNKTTPGCKIYVFDNSDKEPFVNIFDNVEVIDNTKGQIINWNEWKKKFIGNKRTKGTHNNYASAKHCYTIEKFIEMFDENFVLLDSDVLIKKDFSNLYDDNFIYVAEVRNQVGGNLMRVCPFICFINVKLCKEKGIHFFNEYYMHGLGNGEGDNWDTGTYFYKACKDESHREIKYGDYLEHLGNASWKHKNVMTWLNKYKNLWKDSAKNKKVIYTCISGKYDTLVDPEYISKGYDYVCFTDQPFISNIWQIRPIPEELNYLSDVKRQRCIKINSHRYLPEYDFSVWVDANISLKGDINTYVNKNCNDEGVVLYVSEHPQRDCIYEEGRVCIKLKKDTKENVNRQLDAYRKEGFPEHYGLPQTGIILRYHNDETCKKLMETWWEQLERFSHRDQLSFSYALWKNEDVKIKYLSKTIFNCSTFKLRTGHKKPYFSLKQKNIKTSNYSNNNVDRKYAIENLNKKLEKLKKERIERKESDNNFNDEEIMIEPRNLVEKISFIRGRSLNNISYY